MSTDAVTPLRHRMIEDMNARKLSAGTQRGHIRSCKRFAAFLNRSPDTATSEDIRRFQLHLAEAGEQFKSAGRVQQFLSAHDQINNFFRLRSRCAPLDSKERQHPARELLSNP